MLVVVLASVRRARLTHEVAGARRRGDGVQRTRCLPRRQASAAALADAVGGQTACELPLLASNRREVKVRRSLGKSLKTRL